MGLELAHGVQEEEHGEGQPDQELRHLCEEGQALPGARQRPGEGLGRLAQADDCPGGPQGANGLLTVEGADQSHYQEDQTAAQLLRPGGALPAAAEAGGRADHARYGHGSAQDAGQRRRDLPGEQDAEQSDDGKEDAGAPAQDGHDVLLSRLLR